MWVRIFCSIFILSLAAIAERDIRERIIPDMWIIICLFSGISMLFFAEAALFIDDDFSLIYQAFRELPGELWTGFSDALLQGFKGAFGVWGIWLFMAAVSALFGQPPPFGMGDARLFAVLSLCLGPMAVLRIFCLSCLLSGLWCAALLALKKIKRKDQIAFGPFISLSTVIYLLSSSHMCFTSLSMLQV
jgi:prepilin signal peptidase PulO-like enzyme (type II secretory pathway)